MISPRHSKAFTLIELLTVIAIIAVLMGLLFPAIGSVKESARKTQAKNDEMQIINAVKAYYTEYGKYPVPDGTTKDYTYGGTGAGTDATNDTLFNVLRVIPNLNGAQLALNPRQVVFIDPPMAKDAVNPKSGISQGGNVAAGQWVDPWGTPYFVRVDSNYDNQLANPYTGAGFNPMNGSVISWSYGKDKKLGANGSNSATASGFDDVLSWQ